MAREEVVKIQCDRCPRVEYQPKVEQIAHRPALEVKWPLTFEFQDLCGACRQQVNTLIDELRRKRDKATPELSGAPRKKREPKDPSAEKAAKTLVAKADPRADVPKANPSGHVPKVDPRVK